jgi:hypothetical protein
MLLAEVGHEPLSNGTSPPQCSHLLAYSATYFPATVHEEPTFQPPREFGTYRLPTTATNSTALPLQGRHNPNIHNTTSGGPNLRDLTLREHVLARGGFLF